MLDIFDSASLEELSTALAGTYSMTVCGGAVRVLCRQLPGQAVSALVRGPAGVLYVVLDLDKPSAIRTAWNMVQDWLASFRQPDVTTQGTVVLVPLPRLPDPPGPASLSLVGG